jgi:hypothetical protein
MTFLYLNSDVLGSGTDRDLGIKLLNMFLSNLAASAVKVELVGCVNAGVFLTTRDGPALESLRALKARGARIASCGTCLDHFGLRGSLKLGDVGSMDQTIQATSTADKILSLCGAGQKLRETIRHEEPF